MASERVKRKRRRNRVENEEIDLQLEYERVTKQRYEDFQEWLNKCPLVVVRTKRLFQSGWTNCIL